MYLKYNKNIFNYIEIENSKYNMLYMTMRVFIRY